MKHSVVRNGYRQHASSSCTSVDPKTGEIERIKLRRDHRSCPSLLSAGRAWWRWKPGGSAHWWGRKLGALGHEVRLLAPRCVRPFVRSQQDRRSRRASHLDGGCSSPRRPPGGNQERQNSRPSLSCTGCARS